MLERHGGSFTVVRSSGLWAEESTRAALPSLEKSAREATGPGRALPVQLPWKPLSLQRFWQGFKSWAVRLDPALVRLVRALVRLQERPVKLVLACLAGLVLPQNDIVEVVALATTS